VNEDLEKFAEGDGPAGSCEYAIYQNNGIIHLRVGLHCHDVRPYCTCTFVLHFASVFALRELLFVANFNDRFVSLGIWMYIQESGPTNSLFQPFNWSRPDSQLQVQSERSLHLIELGKSIEVCELGHVALNAGDCRRSLSPPPSSSASRRPVINVCAPFATDRFAVARLMPLLPPVTGATLPSCFPLIAIAPYCSCRTESSGNAAQAVSGAQKTSARTSNRSARADSPSWLANRDCFGRSRIVLRRYFQ
jgi:hypothetical protein